MGEATGAAVDGRLWDVVEDGDVRAGVGLRRARIPARLLYGDVAEIEYDVDAASGAVQSVDLFAFVNPAERVQVGVGYMVAPQPRAFIGTLSS